MKRRDLLIAIAAVSGAVAVGAAETPSGRTWPDRADGFASVNALGQDGTTGGAGGKTVTVTTRAELEEYAAKKEPYIIRVKGAIAMKAKGKEARVDVASDKTIIGVGKNAELVEGGLYVGRGAKGIHYPRAHNVIIRNLTIRKSRNDGVTIDNSHHIWVDHCEFFGHADGCLDSRKGTTYLTVSWCIFRDSFKPFGIGWDLNFETGGDRKIRKIRTQMTIHHNWFRNNQYRNPRAGQVRRAHLYNNYLKNIGVRGNWASDGTRMVLENSFFENVNNPHDARSPGGPKDLPGAIVARGNVYRNTRGSRDGGGKVEFEPGDFYKYTLDKAEDIPEIISKYAGPQEDIGASVKN